MEQFASDFLANLIAELAAKMLEGLGARAREAVSGPEAQRALKRAIQAGVVALLAQASTEAKAPEQVALLQDIFHGFFADPFVGRELSKLLRGKPLDTDELAELFEQAGYDARTLPGLDFASGMRAFEAAFVDAALNEPALRERMQSGMSLEQTRLLQNLSQDVSALRALLKDAKPGSVGIQAGRITAQNVVSGVQIIHQWGAKPAPDTKVLSLREAYLNHLLETADRLSLSGIDPKAASDAKAHLNLHAVYTALLTLSPAECKQPADPARLAAARTEQERLSVLAQADRHKRLVLLGAPGSGKSTFVSFLCVCLAGEALRRPEANVALLTEPLPQEERRMPGEAEEKPKPQPWRHGALLPFRLVLRDFAVRGGLPASGQDACAQHLWDFIAAELRAAALDDYAPHLRQEWLAQGGLLLLDGLDEVPEAENRRVQIKQAVEDFAAAFKKCRILVTSRTYAYQQQDWRLDGFDEAVIAPLSRGQMQRFVERWYAHIAPLRGLNAKDAEGRATLLKQAILSSDRLLALAESPLLLTLMASLHAWRGGSLPQRREQLYAEAVDLLLDWWESAKLLRGANGKALMPQPSLSEWLQVDRDRVRELLNELAYEAHAGQAELEGTADVPKDRLVGRLMELKKNPDVRPERLVEYLSERAGLLLPRGVGVYTFAHRTFQEYLAACYLTQTSHGYPDAMARLARERPERWREVALLAAAHGGDLGLWALVDALCCHDGCADGAQSAPDAWGALLAGQALVESANLEQVSEPNQLKLGRVRSHLARVLEAGQLPAVDRAAAGQALAKLRDPRRGVGVDSSGLPDIVWCYVPAGPFVMGEGDGRHENTAIAEGFLMSRYPITNAQFAAFVQAEGYRQRKYWPEAQRDHIWAKGRVKGFLDDEPRQAQMDFGEPFNLPNHPAVGITWYEALAFCRWLQEQLPSLFSQPVAVWREQRMENHPLLGDSVRIQLPSEAEWEKAARGMDGREYPWGDKPDPNLANYADTGIGTTSAVGCFPGGASPYGVEDLSGNVWEWTRSLGGFKYPYKRDKREDLRGSRQEPRVLRGGSFDGGADPLRCACRLGGDPGNHHGDIGFRVVASPILL